MAQGLFSPSVRGNLLDLEHIWADADSPTSPYQPVSAHLVLSWHEGLPYWGDLTEQDRQAIIRVTDGLTQLLTLQGVRLKWLPFHLYPTLYPQSFSAKDTAQTELLYPAYTLVAIPARFKMPSPRYTHTHTPAELNNHPPVKVRWPEPGFNGLRDFIVEAMLLEGIAAWPWPSPAGLLGKAANVTLDALSYLPMIAVATAPWFAANAKALPEDQTQLEPKELMARQSPEIKHIGTAVAKLDFYLFARP